MCARWVGLSAKTQLALCRVGESSPKKSRDMLQSAQDMVIRERETAIGEKQHFCIAEC